MKKFKITIYFEGKEETRTIEAIDKKDALVEFLYQAVLTYGKEFISQILSKFVSDEVLNAVLDMTSEIDIEEVE